MFIGGIFKWTQGGTLQQVPRPEVDAFVAIIDHQNRVLHKGRGE